MLLDQLTKETIRSLCNAKTYQRGQQYFKQGRVLDFEYDSDAQVLYASVQGSRGYFYEQEIFFSDTGSGLEVEGDCTCPMEYNCKHVVAALLDFLQGLHHDREDVRDRLPPRNKDALDIWRTRVQEAFPVSGDNIVVRDGVRREQLLFVLDCEDDGCFCRLLKSRRLKKGGWGKASSCHVRQILEWYYRPPWVTDKDTEIVSLLHIESPGEATLELTGDVGMLALRKMIETGRCFVAQPSETPLSFAEPKTLSLGWRTTASGERQLHCQLDDGEALSLIPTIPPCYLDKKRQCCGELISPLSSRELRLLRQLPPVPENRTRELALFMLQTFPGEDIPLPVDVRISNADSTCVPHLRLMSRELKRGRRVHVARLTFDYPPLSFDAEIGANHSEIALVEHDGGYWRVKRDSDVEYSALAFLSDRGFQPATTAGLSPVRSLDLVFPAETVATSAAMWKAFLNQLAELESAGWQIDIEPSFQLRFVAPDELTFDVQETPGGWFDLGLDIWIEGRKIALLPLLAQYLEQGETEQPLLVELQDGRWLECPKSVVEPVVETLVELYEKTTLDPSGSLSLPTARIHALSSLQESLPGEGMPTTWRGDDKLKELAERLRRFDGIESVAAPRGLAASLRDYQQKGMSWLQFLRDYAFGGILADDMGLGKTLQALAHVLLEKESGRLDAPTLVVSPTSVLSTWRNEARRFAADLTVMIWHGPQRKTMREQLPEQDLIVTSYALLQRDAELFQSVEFHLLILDEAQAIKNPTTKMAQAACSMQARHRLCLTGTPVENHLGELWSLFHFLMPGYLGGRESFSRLFRSPIEKAGNVERRRELERRIHPFVLRRDKQQVATELPPKTTIVSRIEFESAQARLYESVRSAMSHKVSELLARKGLKKSHIEILEALLKLRQVCCDPRLLKLESARKVKQSAKLERLLEMLETLLSEGRKILIFSQFTSMLSLIEKELDVRSIGYSKLTGRTRKRDEAIARFQEGEVPLFLISLKAGGVGLNLTAADTVIHYDPWWNPAVENQATDRAYRIGQDKPVFVYKLVAQGTIEEKILDLQEKKRQLAEVVCRQEGAADDHGTLTGDELLALFED
ncbi:DEAD/DEAH box helicase [uncultured Desulfuromonas sp.]|uniref:DEAD/DEAH box helicase n=1 Tax=uncultured Desulfuromonas sp. TaxID=181013 RepID=UPI002AAC29D0|nr:DEAD/DEAH box helicase [uncultured Desulfuromonas sp.]